MPLITHSQYAAQRGQGNEGADVSAAASLFSHFESLETCHAIARTRRNFLLLSWPMLGFLLNSGLAPAGIYAVLSILRRQMIRYHGTGEVGPVPVNTAALARQCGVSERSIQREIKKAESLGLLKRRLRRAQCRSYTTLMEVALPDQMEQPGEPRLTAPETKLRPETAPATIGALPAAPAPAAAEARTAPDAAAGPARRPRLSLASRIRQQAATEAPPSPAPVSDKNGAWPADRSVAPDNNCRTQSEINPWRRSAGSAHAPDHLLQSRVTGGGCRVQRGVNSRGSPGYWVETATGAGFVVAEAPRFDTVAGHAVRRMQGTRSLPEICELLQQFEFTLHRRDRGRPALASLNGLLKLALHGRWSTPYGYCNYVRGTGGA